MQDQIPLSDSLPQYQETELKNQIYNAYSIDFYHFSSSTNMEIKGGACWKCKGWFLTLSLGRLGLVNFAFVMLVNQNIVWYSSFLCLACA